MSPALDYPGKAELKLYVENTEIPYFCSFVNSNLLNIICWSDSFTASKPKNVYLNKTWELLINGLNNAKLSRLVYVVNDLEIAVAVSGSVKDVKSSPIVESSSTVEYARTAQIADASQTSRTVESDYSAQSTRLFSESSDIEIFLYSIGHQRAAGVEITSS
ncbi:hypothetical protein INT48_006891 [Thamnidium elegans]|uniref:Uncharacterized protein n=1 Tax=Thamnidium elegans TaxID=101142 RepID=A0A8H7VQ34_9FUNG|nr:hypothetical protein INT48_006891 [Thamnidium elegans]